MPPLRRISQQPPPAGAYTAPGSMTNQVTLLMPGARRTDGGHDPSSTFATSWASVRPLAGQELYKAQQIVSEVSHLVTIPYVLGVTESMQVKLGNRILQIKAIQDPDEQQFELRMLCVERNQNG